MCKVLHVTSWIIIVIIGNEKMVYEYVAQNEANTINKNSVSNWVARYFHFSHAL